MIYVKFYNEGFDAARYDVETKGFPHATDVQTQVPEHYTRDQRIAWMEGYTDYFYKDF